MYDTFPEGEARYTNMTHDGDSRARRIALSFDVGGTFTDFVAIDIDAGEVAARHKVLTNSRYPARGVTRGWSEMEANGLTADAIRLSVHSTTLVTNALIERKGATTVLLATRGFRDLLELAREQMYDIYDLFAPPPEPLIPRPLRLEIDERTHADPPHHHHPTAHTKKTPKPQKPHNNHPKKNKNNQKKKKKRDI